MARILPWSYWAFTAFSCSPTTTCHASGVISAGWRETRRTENSMGGSWGRVEPDYSGNGGEGWLLTDGSESARDAMSLTAQRRRAAPGPQQVRRKPVAIVGLRACCRTF